MSGWTTDGDGNPAWVSRYNVAWDLTLADLENGWPPCFGRDVREAHDDLVAAIRAAEKWRQAEALVRELAAPDYGDFWNFDIESEVATCVGCGFGSDRPHALACRIARLVALMEGDG